MKMITIEECEYNQLKKDGLKLAALEETGVDNWPGFSDAMKVYRELLEDFNAD